MRPAAIHSQPVVEIALGQEERERILRELKAQVYAAHLQVPSETAAVEAFRCNKREEHAGAFEPAPVCNSCYEQLRERAHALEIVHASIAH